MRKFIFEIFCEHLSSIKNNSKLNEQANVRKRSDGGRGIILNHCLRYLLCHLDHSSSPEDIYFDTVVEALQDIILDEHFENMQQQFLNKYCQIFEENEENKFEYT